MSIIPTEKIIHGIRITDSKQGIRKGKLYYFLGFITAPFIIGFKYMKIGKDLILQSSAWHGSKFYKNRLPQLPEQFENYTTEALENEILVLRDPNSGKKRTRERYILETALRVEILDRTYESKPKETQMKEGVNLVDTLLITGDIDFAVQSFDRYLFKFTTNNMENELYPTHNNKLNWNISIREVILLALMHYDNEAWEIMNKLDQRFPDLENQIKKNGEEHQLGLSDESVQAIVDFMEDLGKFARSLLRTTKQKYGRSKYLAVNYFPIFQNSKLHNVWVTRAE